MTRIDKACYERGCACYDDRVDGDAVEVVLAQTQEPVCPDCKAKVLYECVACSSNNYPPQRTEQCNYPDCKCPTENPCLKGLAQPEQEPVAWLSTDSIGERYLCFDKPLDNDHIQPLYTSPPQRTWVGLTKKEILLVNEKQDESIIAAPDDELIQFARAIEAKLKQKNGYAEEKNNGV